jgi:hypothetical protein
LGIPYQYNPTSGKKVKGHVHVLAGVDSLRYAIELKGKSRIHKLTAGPNIVISSADHDGLVASPEIDLCLVPSEWTKAAYLIDNPRLKNRISFFPSGVDADFWKIKKTKGEQLRLAFYKKRPEPLLYEECLDIAKSHGASVTEIIYGNYTLDTLKKVLAETDFVIYFVEQESQGIALTEIWATDTPTIVWNPGFWNYKLKNYQCSSAPYLTSYTGKFFRTGEDFSALFKEGLLNKSFYSPRQWVLQNMTDEICTKFFLEKIGYEA